MMNDMMGTMEWDELGDGHRLAAHHHSSGARTVALFKYVFFK